MNKLKFLASIFLFVSMVMGKTVTAHDFSVTVSGGNKLFLNVTDTLKKTVEVTYEGSVSENHEHLPEGMLYIPETVKYKGQTYTITAIGPKAFSEAVRLEGVVLSASLSKIEAFAFEGCTGLKTILYPGSPVSVGEGAFFRCDRIESVSFGSDWISVNLAPYVWSDSLKELEIPAKVKKLINLKVLRSLEKVHISINNSMYSSKDGLLYSKDSKILYAAPCAYRGSIVVPEGTETVLEGAFRNCLYVENIELPGSVKQFSYLEFIRAVNLKSITLRAEEPINTAKHGDTSVFALGLPSPGVVLYVPKSAYNAYCTAICHEAGAYENINGKQREIFENPVFATKENIKKIK